MCWREESVDRKEKGTRKQREKEVFNSPTPIGGKEF